MAILVINVNALSGFSIKVVNTIGFLPDSAPPPSRTFVVTEDEIVLVPSQNQGNLPVFERNGDKLKKLEKAIGKRGFGLNEFMDPYYSFYNKKEGKLGILDYGKRTIMLYDRVGRTDFKLEQEIECLKMATDIHWTGDKLYISGFREDESQQPFDFYYEDVNDHTVTNLLPSWRKYGLKSANDYENEYRKKPDIRTIGIRGWFSIQGNHAYYIWEGSTDIIKININDPNQTRVIPGKKSSHYKQPGLSPELPKLIELRKQGKFKEMAALKTRLSYVRDVFTSPDFLMMIIEGPDSNGIARFYLQIYELDGNFKQELVIPGNPGRRMVFDSDGSYLYSLSDSKKSSSDNYLMKYKIYFQ